MSAHVLLNGFCPQYVCHGGQANPSDVEFTFKCGCVQVATYPAR
jgi:hypothetical protein